MGCTVSVGWSTARAGAISSFHTTVYISGVNDNEKYDKNVVGLWTRVLDFRFRFLDEKQNERPLAGPGNLYVDTSFSRKIGKVKDNKTIEWKRPQEFLKDPRLCNDETNRFDIKQGGVGNCYFLSVLAGIADKKAILSQLLPESAYTIEDPEKYDGMFHARFFQFGKWVDVYTDDYLPVVYGNKLWGAKSPDENKLWVALIEKAFARIHGSYENIISGDSEYAFLLLTGGISERTELTKHKSTGKSQALFERIKNAIDSGCQIVCEVPEKHNNQKGLVGNHKYSLVGVYEHKDSKTKLIMLRNPWGHTEWNGAWSDGSSEWSAIPQNSVVLPKKDNGEFFISLPDFMRYFSDTTFCSLTPDFDEDGKSSSLNYMLSIYGEWNGKTAAGFENLTQNPRFEFTATQEGFVNNSFIPLLVQIIQQSRTDITYIRCNVFKVLQDRINYKGHHIALEVIDEQDNVYTKAHQVIFRYKLKPGRYIIVPSTKNRAQEKAFLLRLFTSAPLKEVKYYC